MTLTKHRHSSSSLRGLGTYNMGNGVFAFECLGDIPGPRWLDGRTADATVGIMDSTGYSGTRWQVIPN